MIYTQANGFKKGLYKRRPTPYSRPAGIAIHTTGSGPARRVNPLLDPKGQFDAWRRKNPAAAKDTFTAALWLYTKAMRASPHYLVGQRGDVAELVPDEFAAWHVGSRYSNRYDYPGWRRNSKYAWWVKRWPEHVSPKAFLGGQLWNPYSANDLLIGIDVAPPADNPTGEWSDACKQAVADLAVSKCMEHRIPCTRNYVLTHSDAHPVPRTAWSKPWDPGPEQWPGFGDWFSTFAGSPT